MENFYCDCCGLCCQNVGKSFLQIDFDRGDGVCKNFDDKTKLCKIYKNRPLICNVDAYYEKFLSQKISRADFYKMNYNVCKKLKAETRSSGQSSEISKQKF